MWRALLCDDDPVLIEDVVCDGCCGEASTLQLIFTVRVHLRLLLAHDHSEVHLLSRLWLDARAFVWAEVLLGTRSLGDLVTGNLQGAFGVLPVELRLSVGLLINDGFLLHYNYLKLI